LTGAASVVRVRYRCAIEFALGLGAQRIALGAAPRADIRVAMLRCTDRSAPRSSNVCALQAINGFESCWP